MLIYPQLYHNSHLDEDMTCYLISKNTELLRKLSRGIEFDMVSSISQIPVIKSTNQHNVSDSNQILTIVIDKAYFIEYNIRLDLKEIRQNFPSTFLIVFDPSAVENPFFRLECFDNLVNMVAYDVESIYNTLMKG